MLLKEDGHLDIEKVEQLNEEKLIEEMKTWDDDQWYEWDHKDGSMTHEEVFGYLRRKIKEHFGKI